MNKNSPNIIKELLVIANLILVILLVPLIVNRLKGVGGIESQAQSEPSFTFTAAGDYKATTRTTALLTGMNPANSGASFNIALGDLAYAYTSPPETVWCDYIKSKVGADFPFELVSGNHEDNEPTGANINGFVECLPHKATSSIVGTYGKEFYFDYPVVSPNSRFIFISPSLTFTNEGSYSYTLGNAHYNFVSNAIDNARASGIKWIVVSMHENCISMGVKTCSIGERILNLLIDKKVDLIIQGHDHNYQRSKQLALLPGCTGLVSNTFNANCVVDSDNVFEKGAGSVLAIVGTGGVGNYDTNPADAEAQYFATHYGSGSNTLAGFLRAVVTDTTMSVSFDRMAGPAFSDSFTIVDNSTPTLTPEPPTPTPTIDPFAPTPIDTPTPTITPIPTDTPTPTPTSPVPLVMILNPIEDTYANVNQPNKNFGGITSLQIDGVPTKQVYLKFDLTPLFGNTIQSAFLRLRVSASSTGLQNINLVPDNSWSETILTYNNRPATGSLVTTFPGGSSGTWVQVDVTSAVTVNAGQLFSINENSISGDGMDFYSKESGLNAPQLVVTYQ